MLLKSKLFCHWDLIRFVGEEHILTKEGKNLTLSVTDGGEIEYMIFLEKDESNSIFEVRVYKAKSDDKYIPNEYDEILRYEECDEYATFFFNDYEKARNFVYLLGYVHSEYKVRPVKKIEWENRGMVLVFTKLWK